HHTGKLTRHQHALTHLPLVALALLNEKRLRLIRSRRRSTSHAAARSPTPPRHTDETRRSTRPCAPTRPRSEHTGESPAARPRTHRTHTPLPSPVPAVQS